jgi:GAF domain-containing protein
MYALSARAQRQLEETLQVSISLQGADMGNIQLLDEAGALRIVAHRGFHPDLLEHFKVVRPGDGAPCERALAAAKPVVVTDVYEDAAFAPHLAVATRSGGIRAVQSIPLLNSGKKAMGVMSILYEMPLPTPEWRMEFLQASAIRTAALLEHLGVP